MIPAAAVTSKQVVGLVTAALLAIGGGGYAVAAKHEAAATLSPADVAELRATIKTLSDHLDKTDDKLDRFNTRLSWLEGATSGATGREDSHVR